MDNLSIAQIKKLSFEDAMAKLEDIVNKLEAGKVKLDDAVNIYTTGNALKEHCENKLKEAKTKIEKISIKDGNLSLEKFED